MAEISPQSYANHGRFDPPFHFFVIPVLTITFVTSIVHAVRHPGLLSAWAVVFVAALVVLTFKVRLYALKVQDRVIRLEERLRLATLAHDSCRSRISELSEAQLIALRFASDDELPALVELALNQKLGRKEIKKAVTNWRPDYLRV
jgi:Family of unknown function (DUF6526)